jgi:acetolactate synthase-like protein
VAGFCGSVKHVFTLVGGHISPILVACEKRGVRVIDTRHEVRDTHRER